MDKEISTVERKYFALQRPLLQSQHQIICGERTANESELSQLDKCFKEADLPQKENLLKEVKAERIDRYWVKVFENCEILSEEMKPKDKDVLKYLNKIELIKEENSENF